MARAHQRHQLGEERHRLEDAGADVGVLLHHGDLLACQRPGLSQDRLGDADLADVVQQRAQLDDPGVGVVELELGAHASGQVGDLAGVVVGVGILGLESSRQGAQRGEVGVLQPLGHPRPRHHRPGLGRQRRGQPQLAVGERPRTLVVDLDQGVRLRFDGQREHQQRAVAELHQPAGLGGVDRRAVERACVWHTGAQHLVCARVVGQRVLLGSLLPAVGWPCVAGPVADDAPLGVHHRDQAGAGVEELGQLAREAGQHLGYVIARRERLGGLDHAQHGLELLGGERLHRTLPGGVVSGCGA